MRGASSSEKVRNISLSVLEMILSRLQDISSDLFDMRASKKYYHHY